MKKSEDLILDLSMSRASALAFVAKAARALPPNEGNNDDLLTDILSAYLEYAEGSVRLSTIIAVIDSYDGHGGGKDFIGIAALENKMMHGSAQRFKNLVEAVLNDVRKKDRA